MDNGIAMVENSELNMKYYFSRKETKAHLVLYIIGEFFLWEARWGVVLNLVPSIPAWSLLTKLSRRLMKCLVTVGRRSWLTRGWTGIRSSSVSSEWK